jgi:hypothetical protein
LTLRTIPIQVTVASSTAADNIERVINTVKLYRGADLIDSVSGDAGYQFTSGSESTSTSGTACADTNDATNDKCTFYFSNLANPGNMITAGSEAEFRVVVDLKAQSNYAEGTTIQAALVNADVISSDDFSVQDANGDQLTDANSSIRVGSAVGEVMTLRVNGVQVTMGATTYTEVTDSGNVTQVTYTIPLTVTAFGNTLYMGQTADYETDPSTMDNQAAVSFELQSSTAPTTGLESGSVTSTFSCNATLEGGTGYRLDSGVAKSCTLQVILTTPPGGTPGSYRVAVEAAQTYTDAALTAGEAIQLLLPVQNYQTGYRYIAS